VEEGLHLNSDDGTCSKKFNDYRGSKRDGRSGAAIAASKPKAAEKPTGLDRHVCDKKKKKHKRKKKIIGSVRAYSKYSGRRDGGIHSKEP